MLAGSLVLACLMVLLAPTAFAALPTQVTLTVNQVFDKSALSAPPTETFYYQLKPKSASNPMPEGAIGGTYTFAITGNTDKGIGPIVFSAPGRYRYEILHITDPASNYVYDYAIYTIDIYVSGDGTYYVVVNKEDGYKAISMEYRHTYSEEPTTAPPASKPPLTTVPHTSVPRTTIPHTSAPPSTTNPPSVPSTTTPAQTTRPQYDLPRTNDTANMLLWISLTAISFIGLLVVIRIGKSKRAPRNFRAQVSGGKR